MIFDELVSEICERLNLTSDEAKSRVSRELNNRYRRVTSSIGLSTSRRTQVSATAVIGNSTMTFLGVEKIINVINKSSGSNVILTEVTPEELRALPITKEPPHNYAIITIGASSVKIEFDCVPTTNFVLYADGHASISTIAGSGPPGFPESFHDLLITGVMADEYRKMEKLDFARDCEAEYESRLSDLRMWIAKSAYLDITQGRLNSSKFPWINDPFRMIG